MIALLVIGTLISSLSVFAFFGNAFANTGGSIIPSMFDLMFGGSTEEYCYIFVWNQYEGLTFLFVLEVFIIIVAVITWFVCIISDSKTNVIICGIVSAISSFIGLVISFCTLEITNIDPHNYGVKLGFGPIFYSILNIIAVLLIISGFIYDFINENYYLPDRHFHKKNAPVNPVKTEKKIGEEEKIDLLLKYKKLLDSGVITEKEYEVKKEEIL